MTPEHAALRAHKRLWALEAHAQAAGTTPPRHQAPDTLAGAIAARVRYHLDLGLPLTYAFAERVAADALALVCAVDAGELDYMPSGMRSSRRSRSGSAAESSKPKGTA